MKWKSLGSGWRLGFVLVKIVKLQILDVRQIPIGMVCLFELCLFRYIKPSGLAHVLLYLDQQISGRESSVLQRWRMLEVVFGLTCLESWAHGSRSFWGGSSFPCATLGFVGSLTMRAGFSNCVFPFSPLLMLFYA